MNLNLSFKNQPKISKKDLMALGILAAFVLVCLLITLLLLPNIKSFNENKQNVEDLEPKVSIAKIQYNSRAKYTSDLKALEEKLNTLSNQIPKFISQEDVILTLGKYSKDSNLKLTDITFGAIQDINMNDLLSGKITTSDTPQAQTGNNANSTGNQNSTTENNSNSTAGANSATGSNNILTTEIIKVNYTGSYSSLYKFLKSIENGKDVICTLNITVDSSAGAGKYNGTIGLMFASYREKNDNSQYKLNTPEIKGKSNPFSTEAGDLSATSDKKTTYMEAEPSFAIIINTYRDNASKIMMSAYPKGETQISFDKNEGVKGKLTVNGSIDSFDYSYSIDSISYKGNGKLLISNGKIIVVVMPASIQSDDDKVALTLDIENNTNLPLEVYSSDGHSKKSRFKLGNTTGNVTAPLSE